MIHENVDNLHILFPLSFFIPASYDTLALDMSAYLIFTYAVIIFGFFSISVGGLPKLAINRAAMALTPAFLIVWELYD
jgi:hypothetical protein